MTMEAYTLDELRDELHDMSSEILKLLVQCGMDLVVTTNFAEKTRTYRIISDERHPMREFMDLVKGPSMDLRIEITTNELDEEMASPQLIYNTLSVCHSIAESMLNMFLSMAEATMTEDKESWEKARTLMPDAVAALEGTFKQTQARRTIQEALSKIGLGSIATIRPPSKATN